MSSLDKRMRPGLYRDLVKEGFPLHDDHIPVLLEHIGDHEQDVVETVLAAVANARWGLA